MPDPAKKALDDQTAAAKAAKELADAQRAASDAAKAAGEARKAQSDAALVALKSQIGEVPTSPYTGAVELKDKAGVIEAALLSARAAQIAAERIASALQSTSGAGAPPRKPKLLLYAVAEMPAFQALTAYRTQVALVEMAFGQAQDGSVAVATTRPADFHTEAVPYAAAAGLGLEAVNKLLAFFKTDYTVGGVEVRLEDAVLVNALAGRLAQRFDVSLLSTYNAAVLPDGAGAHVLRRITDLSRTRQSGLTNQDRGTRAARRAVHRRRREGAGIRESRSAPEGRGQQGGRAGLEGGDCPVRRSLR